MIDEGEFDALEAAVQSLEESAGGAGAMAAALGTELDRLKGRLEGSRSEVSAMSAGFSRSVKSAFDGVVFGGERLSDSLRKLAQSMASSAYGRAVRPVAAQIGGAVAEGLAGVAGAVVSGPVTAFAKGGVVGGPTTFPMRGGTGLMGEAGPEAILPLARGPDGRLGVKTGGGGGAPTVVFNITTPDVAGFRKSQGQIAAQMGRVMARGDRVR